MTRTRQIALFLLLLTAFGGTSARQILVVCSDCAVTSVKEAIAQSSAGDRIEVHGGHYREGALTVDKPLELVGLDWPILDGDNEVEILKVTADDVSVSGFVFQNSGSSHTQDIAALKVMGSNRCVINGNRFFDNFFAIYLGKTHGCSVKGNTVVGAATTESFSGNALHLWDCSDIEIRDNRLSDHRDGIYLEFVQNITVTGNISEDNLRYGLHFMFSRQNTFEANDFRRNGAGVAVMYSQDIAMLGNSFQENWGSAAYGLLLKEINDSYIRHNTFRRNTIGLYIDGSNRTEVYSNDFLGNGYALRVLSSSMAVRFSNNNFIGNTFDVSSNGGRSYNAFIENYWDAYEGYDLDRNGIGDLPYYPVRRFVMTVENYPQAIVLLRSPLEQLIEYAERILPVFTPKSISDRRPLMRRITWSTSRP